MIIDEIEVEIDGELILLLILSEQAVQHEVPAECEEEDGEVPFKHCLLTFSVLIVTLCDSQLLLIIFGVVFGEEEKVEVERRAESACDACERVAVVVMQWRGCIASPEALVGLLRGDVTDH